MNRMNLHASIFLGALGVAVSCDTLDVDSLPQPDATASTELVTLTGGAIVFSITDIVQPSSNATTEIALGPSQGKLEQLDGQLFRYAPSFAASGDDKAVFKTTFTGLSTQRLDTINFRVREARNAQDSLDLPCTIIAVDDYYTVRSESQVLMSVIDNDYVCPSLLLAGISISVVKQPEWGTLSMNEAGFTYSKQQGVTAPTDSILYKICDKGSGSVCSFALAQVIFTPEDIVDTVCIREAVDDLREILWNDIDGRISIDVLANDTICDFSQLISLTVIQQPEFGHATVNQDSISYELSNLGFTGTDEFDYQICFDDQECYTATVTVIMPECYVEAMKDHFYLVDSMHVEAGQAVWEILSNDVLCGEELEPVIVQAPMHGVAVIDENHQLVYSDFSSLNDLDSIRYKICDGTDYCSETSVVIERQK